MHRKITQCKLHACRGFQAFYAAKTLAASKRQPVYYKIVLQTDQFERAKKTLFFLNKCLDLYGSNIICARSILGWIVQIEMFEGKLLLSIFVLLLTVVATVGLNDRFGRSLLLIFL